MNEQSQQFTIKKELTPSHSKRILRLFILLLVSAVVCYISLLIPTRSFDTLSTGEYIDNCKLTWRGFPLHVFYVTTSKIKSNVQPNETGFVFGADCHVWTDDPDSSNHIPKLPPLLTNILIFYIIFVIVDQIYLKVRKKAVYLLNILFLLVLFIFSLLVGGRPAILIQ